VPAANLTKEDHIRATEENFWALWSRFGRGPNCVLHVEDCALWFETPLSGVPYNAVIRSRFGANPAPDLDRIIDTFRKRNVPFVWVIHPSSTPSDLVQLLEERGVKYAETVPGMTMDLDELPDREICPSDFELRRITETSELRPIQEMILERWTVPEKDRDAHYAITLSFGICQPDGALQVWAAYSNGEPVCKVLLNMDGRSAGIHGVATKPEARGRGLARMLTLEALHFARERGYRLGMLHSSAMARTLYEKIGFRKVSDFSIYVSGAELHV